MIFKNGVLIQFAFNLMNDTHIYKQNKMQIQCSLKSFIIETYTKLLQKFLI